MDLSWNENDNSKPSISRRTGRVTGRSALFLAEVTGKVGWAVAKPVGRQTGKLAAKGGKAVKDHAIVKYAELGLRRDDHTHENCN